MKVSRSLVWESRHDARELAVVAEYLDSLGIEPRTKGFVLECCVKLIYSTAINTTDIIPPETLDEALDRLASYGLGQRGNISSFTRKKYEQQLARGIVVEERNPGRIAGMNETMPVREFAGYSTVPVRSRKPQSYFDNIARQVAMDMGIAVKELTDEEIAARNIEAAQPEPTGDTMRQATLEAIKQASSNDPKD